MPDIKTRDVVAGTIKAVDRSALAGQRMKDAYVQAKDKAEHSVYPSENSSEEYAADRITDGVSTVAREAIHQVDAQGHRVIQGAQRKLTQRQENPHLQQSPLRSTPSSPKSSPDIPASIPHQPAQNSRGTENICHAQQSYRVSPDGAVTSTDNVDFKTGCGTSIPKQEAAHRQQIASVRAERGMKRASPQAVSSGPKAPGEARAFHDCQAPTEKTAPIRQTVRSTESISIKTSQRAIKTAGSTVKTVEPMRGISNKSTQAAAMAARKTAMEAAKNAQRTRRAAKTAASSAKAMGEAAAKAARALFAAARQLGTLIAAGGWVVVMLLLLLIVCFAGIMLGNDENDTQILPLSQEVMSYEPVIQRYARAHGIGDYVLLIQAVMMQESGGRGNDPMQCSECNFNTLYPHTPGGITDPEYSIDVGIQNLADCLQIAQCESPVDMDAIKLALQGYNYGQGYITWAMEKYGEYTKANAVEFSLKTAQQYGWTSYGDMDYVSHVLRYYPMGQLFYDPDTSQLIVEVAASQIGNEGGELYWRWYGFENHVEWCACFVSWCADQCGYIDAGIIPQFSGCGAGVEWFRMRGQWADSSITPEPGMIIFFDWDKPETGGQDGVTDHVGIVRHVEGSTIYTIEGNSAGDACRERTHQVGNYQIVGYGTPAY